MIWPFLAGLSVGAAAMSLLGAYAVRGWVLEMRARNVATGEFAAVRFHLDIAHRHIMDIEPLAQIGRKVRATRQRSDAKRRGK